MKFKKLISSLTAAVSTSVLAAFTAMTAFADDAAETTKAASESQAQGGSIWGFLLPLILMFLLLYFIAIRPQKKRDRELKEMQENLEVGDEIITGGGIVGIVVRTSDDTVVIETGGERHKLRIKKWAITENVTAIERIKEMRAAAASKKADSAGVASAKLAEEEEDSADKKKSKKNKKDAEEE